MPLPSARRVPQSSRGDGWNVLADVEVFAFAVEADLETMDREMTAPLFMQADRQASSAHLLDLDYVRSIVVEEVDVS